MTRKLPFRGGFEPKTEKRRSVPNEPVPSRLPRDPASTEESTQSDPKPPRIGNEFEQTPPAIAFLIFEGLAPKYFILIFEGPKIFHVPRMNRADQDSVKLISQTPTYEAYQFKTRPRRTRSLLSGATGFCNHDLVGIIKTDCVHNIASLPEGENSRIASGGSFIFDLEAFFLTEPEPIRLVLRRPQNLNNLGSRHSGTNLLELSIELRIANQRTQESPKTHQPSKQSQKYCDDDQDCLHR